MKNEKVASSTSRLSLALEIGLFSSNLLVTKGGLGLLYVKCGTDLKKNTLIDNTQDIIEILAIFFYKKILFLPILEKKY